MKKSLSDWASIAEVIGAAAIVVSLIFVGLQIRSNTKVTQAATFQSHMDSEIANLRQNFSSAEMSRIYSQFRRDQGALSEWELDQGRYMRLATYRVWEDFYLQQLSGTLSEEGWNARKDILEEHAGREMALDFVNDGSISGEFAEYIRGVHTAASN